MNLIALRNEQFWITVVVQIHNVRNPDHSVSSLKLKCTKALLFRTKVDYNFLFRINKFIAYKDSKYLLRFNVKIVSLNQSCELDQLHRIQVPVHKV